jgi:hypothetical protein
VDVTLSTIDRELAAETQAKGCPYCGGTLHSARYPRKPRCARELSPDWGWRWSFCCAREGCRRRSTPPSVRYLGRRVWPAIIVVILSTIDQLLGSGRAERIRRAMGVDRRTLDRWGKWWRETFPQLGFWLMERARFIPPAPRDEELPADLVRRFGPRWSSGVMIRVLRFLSPVTTPRPGPGSRSSWESGNPQRMPIAT